MKRSTYPIPVCMIFLILSLGCTTESPTKEDVTRTTYTETVKTQRTQSTEPAKQGTVVTASSTLSKTIKTLPSTTTPPTLSSSEFNADGFYLKIPEGWIYMEYENYYSLYPNVVFVIPTDSGRVREDARVFSGYGNTFAKSMTLKDFVDDFIDRYYKNRINFTILSESDATISGQPAKIVEISYKSGKTYKERIAFGLVENVWVLSQILSENSENYESLAPEWKEIVSSIKIDPKKVTSQYKTYKSPALKLNITYPYGLIFVEQFGSIHAAFPPIGGTAISIYRGTELSAGDNGLQKRMTDLKIVSSANRTVGDQTILSTEYTGKFKNNNSDFTYDKGLSLISTKGYVIEMATEDKYGRYEILASEINKMADSMKTLD